MLPQQSSNELQIIIKSISYLRTHWYLFILEFVVCMGFGLRNYVRTPPVYDSAGSVLIDSSRRQMYQSVLVPGTASMNQNARKQNLAVLLTGQEVLERFRNALTDFYNTEGRPNYLRPLFPAGIALTGEQLKSYISLSWDKSSDIYSARCTAQTSEAAHDLCLNYLNTIQAYYPEIGQREAMLKYEFLKRQIQSLTRQIQEKEQNLGEFQRRNADFINFMVLDLDDKGLQKLQLEANALKQKIATNRAIKRLLLSSPAAKRGELTARTKSIEALTTQISELQYQRDLTSQNQLDPERQRKLNNIDNDLGKISSQLARLNEADVQEYLKNPMGSNDLRKRVSELELDFRTDTIRLKGLERQIEELKAKDTRYQPQKLEYERLQAELNHRRRLLNNLYSKEQETELELSTGNAEVFRLQEPSRGPSLVSPILSKYTSSAVSTSIFVMVCSLVILMAFFPRLDSEAEINRLNLPVLGKIPSLPRSSASLDDIPSAGFEFLKIMNYRLLRETKDIKCPVVVISSSHSREGKSTVTQLLTLASQAPNRKALLIDGDLLTAHANEFFGIVEDQTPGLKALMEGKLPPGGPAALVAKTMHEGLFCIPRGGRMEPSSAPSFLDPARRAIEVFRKEYDIIFIDTPPIFAANLAHQWVGIADLIVLVARIYVTRPKDVLESLQTCKIFSKAPIGVALNCVPMSGATRRASNYYFSKRKHKSQRLAA